jgi:hypothetical protein
MEEEGRTVWTALTESGRKSVGCSAWETVKGLWPQRSSSAEGGVVGKGRRGSSPWEQPGPEHGAGFGGIGAGIWGCPASDGFAGWACLPFSSFRGDPMRT